MKRILKTVLCTAALAALAGHAQAAVVTLTWTTTAIAGTNVPGSVIGEAVTTTIRVDNGGSSVLSQVWGDTQFLSYRQQGASGWWFESADINLGFSNNTFSTDALGNVITAGNWQANWPNSPVTSSWAGVGLGGWWNNGNNETSCVAGTPQRCVFANNVAGNLIGSNWTAKLAAVPEPASFALAGLALLAAGAATRRRA